MNNQPTVSVVIPCYNGERYLRETLDSVVSQSTQPSEVLVVDDGSTDDSIGIAESFGSPVRVIRQPNRGESVARNRGIDEARGEWIAFLDADDVWRPNKLERQLAVVEPGIAAIHCDLYYIGSRSGDVRIREQYGEDRYRIERLAVLNTFINPGTILVRRELSPRFPEWTQMAEDQIYCLELVRRGRVVLVEEPLTGYRIHAQSQSQSRRQLAKIDWHKSIVTWVSQQTDLSEDTVQTIQAGWAETLVEALEACYRSRNWDDYQVLREYLKQFRGHSNVDEVLRRRPFPRWTYTAYDTMRRIKRGSRRLGRQMLNVTAR